MQIRLTSIIILILSVVLAACSPGGDEGPLPTVMALPTLEQLESTDIPPVEEPTEEPPTATVEPSATLEPTAIEDPTPTVEDTSDTQEASNQVPSFILNSASGTNNNSLPPFMQGGGNTVRFTTASAWEVTSSEPVSAYECADTTCNVVATLQPGESVEVVSEGDEWYSIVIEDQSAFVAAEFVAPAAGALGPGALPPGVPQNSVGPPIGAPGTPSEGGQFPPGVQPGSFTTPPPPAPPGVGD